MVGRISDVFRYSNNDYDVAVISKEELFDPSTFEIDLLWASSDCPKGYQSFFGLENNQLILDDLHIALPVYEEESPPNKSSEEKVEFKRGLNINGVSPYFPKLNFAALITYTKT